MSALDEVFESPLAVRRRVAERVKAAGDVTLPRLAAWNYEPCDRHETPDIYCEFRKCGHELFDYQRIGTTWMYFRQKGVLADQTGVGKTNQILGLVALLKEKGELAQAVIMVQFGAVLQWQKEAQRFAPGLIVETALGTPSQRLTKWSGSWDVMIVAPTIFLRDKTIIERLAPQVLVEDDVDALRRRSNATARAYNRVARLPTTEYVFNVNATPMHIRLEEWYNVAVSVDGWEVFGSPAAFERRHVRVEMVKTFSSRGRTSQRRQVIGYKNMEEFKAKLEPMTLRRPLEVTGLAMPELAPPETVWLEMTKLQRQAYEDLRQGVLRIIKAEGESVSYVAAIAKVTYGAEICSGMFALPDGVDSTDASAKLDWLMDKLTGDFVDNKVIVFTRFKGTVRAIHKRLTEAGIGMAFVWGEQGGGSSKKRALARQSEVDRFWEDPNCRVCVGTPAIERSLNLQVANVLVNYDTLLNPARMHQIVGRGRRVGSRHSRFFVFTLLNVDSQEDRYLDVLERREALASYVWGETSELYDQLSPLELLTLIQP